MTLSPPECATSPIRRYPWLIYRHNSYLLSARKDYFTGGDNDKLCEFEGFSPTGVRLAQTYYNHSGPGLH